MRDILPLEMYFNPHEREARDLESIPPEAQLIILIHTSVKLVTWRSCEGAICRAYFNPHEREARDQAYGEMADQMAILIHTSVKLVTRRAGGITASDLHFNPHEREARDGYRIINM